MPNRIFLNTISSKIGPIIDTTIRNQGIVLAMSISLSVFSDPRGTPNTYISIIPAMDCEMIAKKNPMKIHPIVAGAEERFGSKCLLRISVLSNQSTIHNATKKLIIAQCPVMICPFSSMVNPL